jgi:DNA-binding MarR family transcriptional regulator
MHSNPEEEYAFAHWIGRIRRALSREFEARVRNYEVTSPQFMVLRRLWNGDGILTSVLAAESGVDGATLTGVLDRLEARNRVRRERSTEDRRAVSIYLTDEGRALEDPLVKVVQELNRQALELLTPEEQSELVRLLRRVGEHIEP